MCRMSGVCCVLSYRSRCPSSNRTLLRSQRSSLRNTVIRPARPLATKTPLDGAEIARQERVAVQHEERVAKHRQRPLQRAAGSEQRLAVEHVVDATVPATAVAERLADHLATIPDAEDDALDALAAKPVELVLGERPARHLDERFRDRLGHRPQPRRQAAGENGDGQTHANSTLVPSKSNRKRTSSRPAAGHRRPQAPMVLGVEHQEAAAAGADQLAAERAVLPAELVPLVDLRVAHAHRAPLLVLPVLVHQLAEAPPCRPFSSAARLRRPSSLT